MFGRVLEDVRRQIEPHSGNEEILRTAAKIIVLKEQEHLKKVQEHLQENSLLKADLQRATKEIRWMDETINSLRDELSDAKEQLKKRDGKIISLQQFVNGQKGEVQKLEQSWQQEVSQLKELLTEKDEWISKVEQKREKRTAAYIDVLGLLTSTQAALKDQEQKCAGLEEQHQIRLAGQQESFQKELQNREESFQKELKQRDESFQKELKNIAESFQKELSNRDKSLQAKVKNREENFQKELHNKEEHLQKEVKNKEMSLQKEIKNREELSVLCRQWKEKPETCTENQRQLEETLQMNGNIWKEQEASNNEDILRLSDEIFQLQVNYLSFSCTCFSFLWGVHM